MIPLSTRSVQFRDRSIGRPVAWTWDFGDGNVSSDQHPAHQYAGEETLFTVALRVTDAYGVSSTVGKQIRLPSAPALAAFEYSSLTITEFVASGAYAYKNNDYTVQIVNIGAQVIPLTGLVDVIGAGYAILSVSAASLNPGDSADISFRLVVDSETTSVGTLSVNDGQFSLPLSITSVYVYWYREPFKVQWSWDVSGQFNVMPRVQAGSVVKDCFITWYSDGRMNIDGHIVLGGGQVILGAQTVRLFRGTSATTGSFVDLGSILASDLTATTNTDFSLAVGEQLYCATKELTSDVSAFTAAVPFLDPFADQRLTYPRTFTMTTASTAVMTVVVSLLDSTTIRLAYDWVTASNYRVTFTVNTLPSSALVTILSSVTIDASGNYDMSITNGGSGGKFFTALVQQFDGSTWRDHRRFMFGIYNIDGRTTGIDTTPS